MIKLISACPASGMSFFALPPDVSEAVKVVTTPAVPVQVVGLPVNVYALMPRPSRLFSLVQQFSQPGGYWVSACSGDVLPVFFRRYSGF